MSFGEVGGRDLDVSQIGLSLSADVDQTFARLGVPVPKLLVQWSEALTQHLKAVEQQIQTFAEAIADALEKEKGQ